MVQFHKQSAFYGYKIDLCAVDVYKKTGFSFYLDLILK